MVTQFLLTSSHWGTRSFILRYLELLQHISLEGWIRAGLALVGVFILIPLLVPLANRFGLVDKPHGRKQHEVATPMHGGLTILLVLVITAAIFHDLSSSQAWAFYLAGGLLILVGVVDDVKDLPWRVRVGAQVLAALGMVFLGGVSVQQLSDVFGVKDFALGLLSIPVTVFVVVGVVNALNMADGIDGLAGGQALVSVVLFCCFALYAGNFAAAERLLTVAGSVIGFLCWNLRRPGLPRAEVFLGDAGSMLLGFIIAWNAVRLSQNPAHPVSPVLGPWTIALPLIDTCSLILRRLKQGRSPFYADRDHLHHLMLEAGYTPTKIALGGMLVSLALGLGAAVLLKLGIYRPLLVVLFVLLIGAHYQLTSNRARAVEFLRRLPFAGSRAITARV
jgi:UDP-GlcNAc:undecaprenyl-phosphate GlcNAc-1-phosphate transferase